MMPIPPETVYPDDRAVFWPAGWPHETPETGGFSIPTAHKIMQTHLECSISVCARKRLAYQTLAEAGVLRPDLRNEKYLR